MVNLIILYIFYATINYINLLIRFLNIIPYYLFNLNFDNSKKTYTFRLNITQQTKLNFLCKKQQRIPH